MLKNVRVLIVEDDTYALNMMAMLLARDWRTRVVGELSSRASDRELSEYTGQRIDLVLIDSEMPGDAERPLEIAQDVSRWLKSPRLLFTATQVNETFLEKASHLPGFAGYLLKDEILFALAAAIVQAAGGQTVFTPGVVPAAQHLRLHHNALTLSGTNPTEGFTRREREIAYLGILFNLNQRDVSDELAVSQYWVSEAISKAYDKIGLHEILSGEQSINDYFDDPIVCDRVISVLGRPTSIKNENGASSVRKAPWMATLAFHILTRPKEMRKLDE